MSYGDFEESCGCRWLPHAAPVCSLSDVVFHIKCERHSGLDAVPSFLLGSINCAARAKRPRVVAICGSTRYIEPITAAAWWFEQHGCITFAPLYLPPQVAVGPHAAEAAGVKEAIDELFKRKIDLADEVFVMNIDGYVGESTESESRYAYGRGIPLRWWHEIPRDDPMYLYLIERFPEIAWAS